MPDILSHIICAHESSRNLSKNIRDIIDANKSIFYLGSQGPDIFYYYKVYPWQNSSDVDRFADLIHGNSPNDFFIKGADILKEEISLNQMEIFNSEDKKTDTHKRFAYLCGFLSHYALDTTAHPYIFYFSGIDFPYNHKYLECIIDTLISAVYDVRKKKLHKSFKNIKLSKSDHNNISKYLSEIIQRTFNESIDPRIIKTSFKDIKNIMSIMYDPLKIKRGAIRYVDKLSHLNGKMISATYPAKLITDVDYLNLKHQAWTHPCDNNKVYTSSFLDLFDLSIIKSNKYILNFSYYLIGNVLGDTLKNVLGNNLYDTGLDASENQKMINEQIILDYRKDLHIKRDS